MKTERQLLSKKQLLEIFPRHSVDGAFPGDWESIFPGSGYEFWSLRPFEPTDSPRHIDWKATARTGRYQVREYLAESDFNLMLLYDISKSMAFGEKESLQANIAVSLAYSAMIGNNGCGLILFADDVVASIPPRMGWAHFMKIVTAISQAQPVDCEATHLNSALTHLTGNVPASLAFILSDFFYPIECQHVFLHSGEKPGRHEVNALRIVESWEQALPDDSRGVISLRDYESGNTFVLDLNKWRDFNGDMQRHTEETRQCLEKVGIDLLTLTPEDNYVLKIDDFMKNLDRRFVRVILNISGHEFSRASTPA